MGPEPRWLAILPGQRLAVGSAFLGAVFRVGTGTFASGYRVSLAHGGEPERHYVAGTVLGRQVLESSALGSFPRPAKPITLYEFEVCRWRGHASILNVPLHGGQ